MRSIVPASAALAESDGGRDGDAPLHPDEARVVAGAVEKRRRDFAAGRACARRALAELGLGDAAIPVGASREPRWPAGVVGSITHCEGYCAAVVGWADDIGSIGIDAEPDDPLDGGVAGLVCTPAERRWIEQAPASVSWATLMFSAKESLYKAWFPLTRRALDFCDIALEVVPEAGQFRAHAVRPLPAELALLVASVRGRFTIERGYVMTCALLAPGAA
jgi:4'-phosphopantetheinyl transferase EntD